MWSCGVILYVLLCGKLPFDDEYVPYLFKKIRTGIFTLPSFLSTDAKNIVSGMLRVDPLKRLTIAQIREHPWFTPDLPEYLFVHDSMQTSNFDSASMAEVCSVRAQLTRRGYTAWRFFLRQRLSLAQLTYALMCVVRVCACTRVTPRAHPLQCASQKFQVFGQQVADAVRTGDPTNQLKIAYDLVLERKRLEACGHRPQPSEVELSTNTFLQDSEAAGRTRPYRGRESTHTPAITPAPAGTQSLHAIVPPVSTSSKPSSSGKPHRLVKRSRWHLGMRSKNRPEDIMAEVYRAMKALNFQWKVITPFHARCRCWNQVSGTTMKMSLQLYQTKDHNYLLDFKNLPTKADDRLRILDATLNGGPEEEDEGLHTMEFFELCALLITELGR